MWILFCLVFAVIESRRVVDPPSAIKDVHIVFMNHLDVGYTDYSLRVLNEYMLTYFPKSLSTSSGLPNASPNHKDRYIYTTEPFLLYTLFNCQHLQKLFVATNDTMLKCPDKAVVDSVIKGIKDGDIYFQAFPHNAEPENYDPQLFNATLQFAKGIAKQYGVAVPTVLSQRDVPGMTAGAIPWLLDNGIQGITIGDNGGATPPKVPKIFIWQHPTLPEKKIITMVHPKGYGGDTVTDCVEYKSVALCWGFRGDNAGPHDVKEALEVYKTVRSEYPNANNVFASTHDAFVEAVIKLGTDKLPTFTGEMGDTWIHGVEADPWKEAVYRAFVRDRNNCISKKKCDVESVAMKTFDFLLCKLGEHTFGGDSKRFLANWKVWANPDLATRLKNLDLHPAFKSVVSTWKEQRSFLTWAHESVKTIPFLYESIKVSIQDISPTTFPSTKGFTPVSNPVNKKFIINGLTLAFGAEGQIVTLIPKGSSTSFGSTTNPLFYLQYHTHTETDVDEFIAAYIDLHPTPGWCQYDYGKPNMDKYAHPAHATFHPTLKQVQQNEDTFLVQLDWVGECHTKYGTPATAWVNVTVDKSGTELHYTMKTYLKTPTRILEAMWLSIIPVIPASVNNPLWSLDKLGTPITTSTPIVNGGAKHMHVVQDHVLFQPTRGATGMKIQPYDTPLLSVGKPVVFPTPTNVTADPKTGLHFNLHNNLWDTNYPLWYPFTLEESEVGINQTYRWKISFPQL